MDTSRSCRSCGHANRGNARFCEACGATLETLCQACGQELRSHARFCDACGTPVAPSGGLSETRKTVTIIFSDLVGSTALQEALDAESVRRVMGRFYAAMQAAIERHEGRVEKFVGDAVMGVFGVPAVREDDAIRAARAALDMVASLDELNVELERDWGVRLGMRTGVNTGEVVVAPTGFLVGDPVNVAARLEQAAEPGQVLIGATTARLIRHAVAVEPAPALQAKGKSAALVVHALVASGQAAAVAARVEAPLVGRRAELARLQDLFEDAVAQRVCRLATVIGSPGMGKTRLARELADSLAGGAIVVEGRCEPQGQGITFLPVADVLRDAAGIGEADPPDDVRAKLAVILAGDPDGERIVERDAGVLGLVAPASAEETFWAVRRTLESLARRRPLLVLLDDIHWGQPQFLDLIEHLVQWAVDAPMLILALARPELRERHDSLTRQGTIAGTVIDLEPLPDDDSRELLSSLLEGGELPPALAARVLYTTGGNPLFLGETIRMLADDGVLRRGEDGTIDVDLDGVDVPPTITALLEARIERLGADERSVVERAAVIGKQFYRGAVAVLSPPPVASHVDAHLEALRLKEMVEPDGTYWIDEPVYRFHHVLIRDAAYRALLKEARAELHERFAQWLEEKAGELVGEHEEVIAFHLEQAHEYRRQLGPLDDRGRALGMQAAARLRSAGRRALDRDDLAAATNMLGRAFAQLEPSETAARAEVLLDLAEALIAKGDTVAAVDVVGQLRLIAGGDQRLAARADVLAGQLDLLTGAGRVAETVASLRAAVEVLVACGDGAGEAKGHHVVAQAEALLGQVAAVEEALDHALAAARRAEDRRRITAVLAAAPRAALWGPSPVVRASGRCLDVVRILRMTPGNRHVEAIALRCQAVLEAMRGRTGAAREILDAGRATLEELGLTLELHETAIHAGMVELLAGDAAAAEQHLRVAADGFAALGVDLGRAQASALLARALVEQGRLEEAIAASEDAEEHGGGDLKTTITWCGVRAEALARAGDLDTALALAQRAVDLAEPTDALPDKADASMALARVLGAAGRGAGARAAAAHARDLYAAKEHGAGMLRATSLAGDERVATQPAAEPGDAEIGDPELRDVIDRLRRGWATRDVESLVALYHSDLVLFDHRRVGWGEVRGTDAAEQQIRSVMAAAHDLRLHIEQVHAAGNGAVAMRVSWRGTSNETGGHVVIPIGYVTGLRDGKIWRTDLYEPEDAAAMLARFSELTQRTARPSEDSFADPELRRFVTHVNERYAARDVDGVRALYHPDCVIVDHRQIGWEELHGSGDVEQLLRTMMGTSADLRMHVDELHAADGGVSAMSVTWHGTSTETGGPVDVPVGYVSVARDGQLRRIELYEHEDAPAMIARFVELGGGLGPLGTRPPERSLAEFCRRYAARDMESMLGWFAEDSVLRDHRQLPWEHVSGRDGFASLLAGTFETYAYGWDGIDEVLACDDRVIAVRHTWHQAMRDGGGWTDIPTGMVSVYESGRFVSGDIYDPDDREAMLARYAELGGGQGPLGERPPESFWKTWIRCFAKRDIDAIARLAHDDVTMTDHRGLGWERVDSREAFVTQVRSAMKASPTLLFEADEVLACDERVIAMRGAWRAAGGRAAGPMALPIAHVCVVEDGRMVSMDLYEPDDHAAVSARFAELAGSVRVLGDNPPERFRAEYKRLFDAHDLEGIGALFAENHVLIDHRKLAWEETRGRAAVIEMLRAPLEQVPDVRIEHDEVVACDERVIAVRGAWRGSTLGGGPMEIPFGMVTVIEAGRQLCAHVYEPEDDAGMIARYAELGGGQGPLGDRPPESFWKAIIRCFAARDLTGIGHILSDEVAVADHRPLGWENLDGRQAFLDQLGSAMETSLTMRWEVDEVLACDERVCAVHGAWRGHGRIAGEMVVALANVVVVEDGRLVSMDVYEPDATEAVLARYDELRSGAP